MLSLLPNITEIVLPPNVTKTASAFSHAQLLRHCEQRRSCSYSHSDLCTSG